MGPAAFFMHQHSVLQSRGPEGAIDYTYTVVYFTPEGSPVRASAGTLKERRGGTCTFMHEVLSRTRRLEPSGSTCVGRRCMLVRAEVRGLIDFVDYTVPSSFTSRASSALDEQSPYEFI